MTTWTLTAIPIGVVLKHGGSMKFSELAEVLMGNDPQRFRDEKVVEDAITTYGACLEFDGATVKFNKEATQYAAFPIMERSVQAFLHSAFKDTEEEWQLYPFKSRKNSTECYVGIPWDDIPMDDGFGQPTDYPDMCDFKAAENSCLGGCGYEG